MGWPACLREAVELPRRARRADSADDQPLRRNSKADRRSAGDLHVSAVDLLNLSGILTPGAKIPAIHANLVLYKRTACRLRPR